MKTQKVWLESILTTALYYLPYTNIWSYSGCLLCWSQVNKMTFWSYNQRGLGEIIAISGLAPKPKGTWGQWKSEKQGRVVSDGQECWESLQPPRNAIRPVSSESYSSQQTQRNHVLSLLMLRNIRWMNDSTQLQRLQEWYLW